LPCLVLCLVAIAQLAFAYDERAFTCLAPFFLEADPAQPKNLDEAFLDGPWAPPCEQPAPLVPRFGTFTNDAAAAWFGEGLTRVHLFDPAGAEAAFRQSLQLDATAPAAFWGLALANQHRPGRSALFLEEAQKRLVNRGDLTRLERELIRGWSREDAAKHLETLAVKHPEDTTLRALHLHHILLDDVSGRRPIASRLANDLLVRSLPDGHPATALSALVWREAPTPAALATMRALTEIHPERAQIWQLAADAHAAAGELDQAIELAAAGLARQDFPPDAAPLVRYLARAGRIAEATNLCHQLIALPAGLAPGDPSPPLAGLRLLGDTCLAAGQPAALLASLGQPAIVQLPEGSGESRHAHWLQGLCLVLLERPKDATEVLQKMKHELQRFGAKDEASKAPALALRALLAGTPPEDPMLGPLARAQVLAHLEQTDAAGALLAKQPDGFLADALACSLAWQAGKKREAMKGFSRTLQAAANKADPDLPLLAQLDEIAAAMGTPHWRTSSQRPADQRAAWTLPLPQAPVVKLHRADGEEYSFDAPERPTVLNFFVGIACPACLIQLTEMAPHLPELEQDGIDFLSITPNRPESLREAGLPFTIHSDADEDAFRGFGAHDHFLNRPLHATVLVDSKGRQLWSTVSEAPFTQPEALRRELNRLLEIHGSKRP